MRLIERTFDYIAARQHRKRSIAAAIAVPAIVAGIVITVHSGDTLSGLAAKHCNSAAAWTSIYSANRAKIANPNLIYPGQRLAIKCSGGTAPVQVTSDTEDSPTPTTPRSSGHSSARSVVATSAFQACVISRESGGNSQVMNSSRHYGLYQFAFSTWVAAGGSASLFGNASASYQTSIFWKAYALWGTSPWAPYDGCS